MLASEASDEELEEGSYEPSVERARRRLPDWVDARRWLAEGMVSDPFDPSDSSANSPNCLMRSLRSTSRLRSISDSTNTAHTSNNQLSARIVWCEQT